MDSSTSRRLAIGAVALSVVVAPLAATSSPASGQAATSAATGALDPTLAEPGSAGLPDRDQRYGKKGAPSVLQVADGKALTPPSDAAPDAVSRAYLAAHQADFGLTAQEVAELRVTMEDHQGGATFLRYQQVSEGRDVVGGTALVTVDAKGRVVLAGGSFVPRAGSAPSAALSAADAVAVVAGNVAPGQDADPGRRLGAQAGTVTFENTLSVPDYTSAAPVEARLVTVGTSSGARSAWEVSAERASNAFYTVLVDAVTGQVLLRNNELGFDNQGTVFTGDDPEAGGRALTIFPDGWATSGDTTSGNNVNAYQDAEGDNSAQADDQPHNADRHWNYAWADG